MRRFIDEYGMAILYAIVGTICLSFLAMIFIGGDTDVSQVIENVVENSTNQTLEVQYNINYELEGGYFRVSKQQGESTLTVGPGAIDKGSYYLIGDLNQITSEPLIDGTTGSKYYWLDGDEKLWLTYARTKSYSLPHAFDKTEIIKETTYNKLLFDGWTGSGLSVKTRNAVITKGSTGNRLYKANWTKGYYRIVYDNNLAFMKTLKNEKVDYQALLDAKYDISAWMSGDTPSKVVEYGSYATQDLRIDENNYEFLGHKFASWNTEPNGSGTTYHALSSLKEDLKEYSDSYDKETQQTIVLYAQWNIVPYKISYTTTDLETSANKNPTTYTIIDSFKLNTTTEDDYETVNWYTVNPYAEKVEDRLLHKFGTYSWEGDAFSDNHEPLYEFQRFNRGEEDVIIHEVEDKKATGTYQSEAISYGTYGDLNLFGYKTTGITVYESHITWHAMPDVTLTLDTKWAPEESKIEIVAKKDGFEWSMTQDQISELLGTKEIYKKIKEMNIPGYEFKGLQTEDGVLVFVVDDESSDLIPSNNIDFWTVTELEDGTTVKTWAYGKNLDLRVKWEPIKYQVNLHSNY